MYIIYTVFIIFRLYIQYIYASKGTFPTWSTKRLSLFQTFRKTDGVAGLYQTLGIARSASKRTIRLACADHGLFVFFSNKESQL